MKKKRAVKKKRILSKTQLKATKRNWTKFRIKGMIKSFEGFRKDNTLSMKEELKIIQCSRILKSLYDDWKPTL